MSNKIIAMIRKELIDAARDKRSVMAGLYYAVGTPLLMCAMFFLLIGQLTSPEDLNIKIDNAKGAPDLVKFLSSRGIKHGEAEDTKEIKLIISDDYAANMAKGLSAEVILIADASNEKLQNSIRRLERSLQEYSGEMGSLRLIARGIDPRIMQPIKVNVKDEATPDSKAGMILGLATMTMIYAVFISGMNLAIDTSAGERERNSLALLLSHPVSTWEIVIAKITAVTIFAMVGLILTLLISKVAYSFVPWQELGFAVSVNTSFIVMMLLVGLPVALMAACLQLFVSFMAKSFKEAQSYITIVLILPMMLAMAASYNIAPDAIQWLPISGQMQALIEFIKGRELPLTQIAVSSAFTLAIAIGLAIGMQKSLKSEKIVFGL
ncbi:MULTISPECIES: ABC transporter permease [Shewanella]|uniref:ABC transporter permease n=1 Tax=Shewanella fidelis TaxID=173509 RepID=A0AAW8NSJ9_9GAMM|nr:MULTISPECIES: ABC transporter permease [Shewanella]MDR8525792.1 ABC transporter permease [Shewanella fidelis]MDW4812699.1 ABC transporter permease [Shewanella fidelis]MDW4816447.1 ABC transporter permease [Shewanella fidelis]MDW4820389.1 ABC transporter permease [Shewanella fidelis]MDW4825163.1 ABC transporter permease [Shewanella fidelis]